MNKKRIKTDSIYVPFKYYGEIDYNKIDDLLDRYIQERNMIYDYGIHRVENTIYGAKELKTKLNLTIGLPLVYQAMNDISVGSRENNCRIKDILKLRFKILQYCPTEVISDNKNLIVTVMGLDKKIPIISMYSKQHNPQYPKLSSITLNHRNGSFIFLT